MILEAKRIENSWMYDIPGYPKSHIEEATLGKNKGKTFLISGDYKKVAEIKVLESHKEGINLRVTVADKIEILRENLSFKEVFFEVARKTTFGILEDEAYEGFTYNRYWNGWEMPMFEKEVVMQIMKKTSEDFSDIQLTYDEVQDTFFYHCESDDEDVEPYGEKGHDILDEDGNIHHVYDIGAGSWVWEEVEESEEEDDEFSC